MVNKISPFIPSQVSESIRENTPNFVNFLQKYYEYVEQRENSIGVIQNRSLDTDIDTTLDKYIDEFYSMYGKNIPTDVVFDRRTLIKVLNEVYSGRGTEKSYKLLFQLFFGTDAYLTLPSDQILKASSGTWYQEAYITITKFYGDMAHLVDNVLYIKSDTGDYTFEILRHEVIDTTTARLFYRYNPAYVFNIGTVLYTKTNGTTTALYNVSPSPSLITIVNPGKNFQVGRVFTLPDATIIKVTSIDVDGGITGARILNVGDSFGVSYEISPFYQVPDLTNPTNASITYLDYTSSMCTLMVSSSPVAKMVGKYLDNQGHLSDSWIKLQDSYYYQIFSYVINVGIDISKYKGNILKILHPAGTKYFSTYNKEANLLIKDNIGIDSSYTHRIGFDDYISATDNFSKVTSYHVNIETITNDGYAYGNPEYNADGYYMEDSIFTDALTH